ncbi:MAG TPA: DUF2007 domain-containing protein [Methylophilaceae bacterium]|nr:DUF2007 domain-containing protein [Methylophilaceae bacterium]
MKIVYHAHNALDAYVVKNLLETEGIAAFVQGEYLQGGVGELAPMDLIKVSVNDQDVLKSRALIEAWESSQPIDQDIANVEKSGSEGNTFSMLLLGFVAGVLAAWLYMQFAG